MTKSAEGKDIFLALKETLKALIAEFLSQATKALKEKRVGDATNLFLTIDFLVDLYLKADEASTK